MTRMTKPRCAPWVLGLAIAHMPPARAGAFQDPATIDAAAAAVAGGAGGRARAADRRLRLAACPQPLDAALVQGAAVVACPPVGWRIRLPIDRESGAPASTPVIVRRGDAVAVEYRAPGYVATTRGTAAGDARAGERVAVTLERKLPPLIGVAVAPGTVGIDAAK